MARLRSSNRMAASALSRDARALAVVRGRRVMTRLMSRFVGIEPRSNGMARPTANSCPINCRLILVLSVASASSSVRRCAQAEPARGKAALSVRGKFIDQRIAEFMERNDVPGLAMAIVQAPYIPTVRRLWSCEPGRRRTRVDEDDVEHRPSDPGLHRGRRLPAHEAQKLDVRAAIGKYLPTFAGGLDKDDGLPASAARVWHSRLSHQRRLQGRSGLQARRSGQRSWRPSLFCSSPVPRSG